MSVGIVTGAGRGMGRACVERLRGTVDHLVAADLTAPEIEGTVGVACDVSDPDSVAALVERVSELGPFRSLCHAAGLSPTMAEPRRIVHVNLVGTALLLDGFEPLAGPGSAAVCFSSSSAHMFVIDDLGPELAELVHHVRDADFLDRVAAALTEPGLAYAWSKIGVRLEVQAAAKRWGAQGARVCSLSPGLIDTPMGRQEFAGQPVMQQLLEATPLGRFGVAEELAAAAAFLLSDDASFVSGVDLLVDGGQIAGLKP